MTRDLTIMTIELLPSLSILATTSSTGIEYTMLIHGTGTRTGENPNKMHMVGGKRRISAADVAALIHMAPLVQGQ